MEENSENGENQQILLSGDRNDGNVAVLFSSDKLELRADFYPPMSSGRPLAADDISTALARSNVIHGVLWENIQQAVTSCNLNRHIVRNVIIARGNPPANEILEYFQFNPALKPPEIKADDNKRTDYRSASPFIIVKKGQALAKLKSRKEGRDGKDIYGQTIPHGTVRPDGVSAGTNTRSDGVFIYADINGQLVQAGKVLNVQDSLVIKGPVDYHTGHIVFPGDVFIEGPVSDGFKIYSGGAVTIKQTLDVTEVIAKTDLTVAGGIVGRGRGLLKVGGGIKTKFLENCKAACRKTIMVDADIVNSSVYTLEKIEMGEKGIILASEIYAVQGVRTGGIGKKTGKAARIHCGVDFTAQQEQEKCNAELRILAGKLHQIRELLAAESAENPEPEVPADAAGVGMDAAGVGMGAAGVGMGAERRKKMEETLALLEEEQKNCTAKAAAILARLNADDNAAVEVSGEIAPGTLIEICQIALFVSEPLKHVRIRLNRALGKLVSEPLS
ncbi:hypothetical protein AGMMS50230_09360 [Spirochaetia bacterium]|nr:hypothetical protein AGMMS50230_09360 [Spirochaetia bacterium]